MSRYYGMDITIDNIPQDKVLGVKKTLEDIWFDGLDMYEFVPNSDDGTYFIQQYHEDTLCGGESEEEFAERLTHAVWDVCGCFVPVLITATYLEDLPYEGYEFEEGDYDRYVKDKE